MDRRQFLGGLAMAAMGMDHAPQEVDLVAEAGDLVARCGGRPLLRYRRQTVSGPPGTKPIEARSGYLHPIHAPSGVVVTNDFAPDHAHHRGVFSAWVKTAIILGGETIHPDFWNIQDGTGRVRSDGVTALTGGEPGFRSTQISEARWRDRWEPVLTEVWEVRFPGQRADKPEAPGAAYLFDITSRQTPCVTLELLQYHYGGMAVRGSGQWAKPADLTVLTSEGKDRAAADGAPARWIAMSGPVDARPAGIALLEHPANMRAPNHVRMHPTMPYYVFTPPQKGPITLEAGREVVFRYRVVAHNGRAEKAALDELWAEFAGQKG